MHFILDTALNNYDSFRIIPFYGEKKRGWESLGLSIEHLSGADVESEDNKSSDSALTCKSHQPDLVSGRRH